MLSKRRPRAHILVVCGTQRGGANSDALAKFQFRDVGLLVILIGNVHHFPFFLLLSVQTTQVCSFAPIPSLQDTGIIWAKFMPYLNAQELKSEWAWYHQDALYLEGGLLWCLGMKPALFQRMLGNMRWLEASSHKEWAETSFPSSYSMIRKSVGFSAVGEGRSSAALIWVTKVVLIWVTSWFNMDN